MHIEDIILAINDISIKETNDLLLHLGTQLAGTKVTLQVQRSHSREVSKVQVTLGKYNFPGKSIASSLGKRPYFRGLRVDYSTLLVQQLLSFSGSPRRRHDQRYSNGCRCGREAKLKVGEVITHVNNRVRHDPREPSIRPLGRACREPSSAAFTHLAVSKPAPPSC